MGFVVDAGKRLVTVDHSHNNYCVTTPEGNPVELMLTATLKVTSIFARTKGKRERTDPGDNSPMLYVIKQLDDLKTNRRDIALLCASFRQILPAYEDKGFDWDWIVPLPSSSPVCFRFAEKVHKLTQRGICYPNALSKITAAEVLANLNELRISSSDKTRIRNDIKRFIRKHGEEAAFQIKCINVSLRQHINPLMWGNVPLGTNPPRGVLLIDDMVTSGTSLINAEAIIRHRYPNARIEALTLFGSSK
ncbi:phosphoribosyltransferase [Salmonella enterica subsp. enterica serovar Kiambu]